ncbi:hypothetical protein EDD16DRAFT_535910 [Pisolithus croceorrhizus]|nr:hypothetical protein EDD16DRAFT_535910 [Pisolithus croceorrhizus]
MLVGWIYCIANAIVASLASPTSGIQRNSKLKWRPKSKIASNEDTRTRREPFTSRVHAQYGKTRPVALIATGSFKKKRRNT